MSMRARMSRLRGTGSAGEAASEEAAAAAASGGANADIAEPYAANPADGYSVGVTDNNGLHPAWSGFGVALRSGAQGEYLMRRTEYDLAHRHGTHALGELLEAVPGLSEFHAGELPIDSEQVLYLDLETTGLGVGTGNVPFMVGLGFLQGDQFVVEQTLIRHPVEEYAMLYDLEQRLRNYRYLATYNGKTFDWPLVQNRMIMNGLGRNMVMPLHLDFLHPSRSVWRNTLVSCKLSHIEEERLGIRRLEDVPGALAPQLYYQYLADGNPEPLEGVFAHNELDLLSLACLSIRFGHLLKEDIFERIPYPEETEELVRTGLWLERMGKTSLSEELFLRAMRQLEPSPSSLFMLAVRDKKAGNWERAVVLWQKVVHATNVSMASPGYDACIELSMYYEHKAKFLDQSLHYASEALERLRHASVGRPDEKATSELQNIRKRIQRIQNKIRKQESGAASS